MIHLRASSDRGQTCMDWLDSRHSFSFGDYRDANHMGFGPLRVINEDWINPGGGFPTHPHRDMEIVTYMLEGALEHKDSMGNGSVIRRGDIQRMSAGTGVTHSEFNASRENTAHLLQIWFLPERKGIAPGYEQKSYGMESHHGKLHLVASRDARDGSVMLHQDVDMYVGILNGAEACMTPNPGRLQWLQVAKGNLLLNGVSLSAGDGAAIQDEARIQLQQAQQAEVVLFDMTP